MSWLGFVVDNINRVACIDRLAALGADVVIRRFVSLLNVYRVQADPSMALGVHVDSVCRRAEQDWVD